MKPFLIKTLVAALLLGIVATGLDAVLTWRSLGRQFERYADFNVIRAGRSSADLIVLGNSRARYHYDSRIISERTGLSCYNLGIIGYPIVEQLGKLQYHLSHNPPPKAIIINLDPASWEELSRDTIGRYEQFLDDIRDPIVLGMIKDKVGFRYMDLLPWARFAGYPGYVWKITLNDTLQNGHRGFVADPTAMSPAALAQVIPPYEHLERQFDTYLGIIKAHRQRYWPNTKVLFVESIYFERDSTPILDQLAGHPDAKMGELIRLDLSWVNDTVYFMNRTHLNERGAAHFSAILSDSLVNWSGSFTE